MCTVKKSEAVEDNYQLTFYRSLNCVFDYFFNSMENNNKFQIYKIWHFTILLQFVLSFVATLLLKK